MEHNFPQLYVFNIDDVFVYFHIFYVQINLVCAIECAQGHDIHHIKACNVP